MAAGAKHRRTTLDLLKEIRTILSRESASINEIAENIDASWETTSRCLTLLQSLNIVQELDGPGTARVFRLKSPKSDLRKQQGTLFGIPLTDKEIVYSDFLISETIKQWEKITGNTPNHTQVQKTAVEVAESLNLPVPRAWYLYGKLLLRHCEDITSHPIPRIIPKEALKIRSEVQKTVREFSKYQNTSRLVMEQYQRHGSQLYQVKHSLKAALLFNLNKKSKKDETINLLYQLLTWLSDTIANEDVKEVLQGFVSATIRLITLGTDVDNHKEWICDAYDCVWRCVAIELFINSLLEYGRFERETLQLYVQTQAKINLRAAQDTVAILWDTCRSQTPRAEDFHPKLKKLKGSGKETKPLSEKERRETFEEFMEEDTSEIFREAGLD